MCPLCEKFGAKMACSAVSLAGLCFVVAAVLRLNHGTVATAGPKSFAAAAALLLLFSIAMSVKKSGCCGPEEPKKP